MGMQQENNMHIIIVSGLPGTGKTTLSKKLAAGLRLPLISKDGFKEIIFDTLGYSDREWSRKVGRASLELMDSIIISQLESGNSLIVESNFSPEFYNEKFHAWAQKYEVNFIQVTCHTEGKVLAERFYKRVESGERHPGHVDNQTREEFQALLSKGGVLALEIPGEKITVDTTDFARVDYEDLTVRLQQLLTD